MTGPTPGDGETVPATCTCADPAVRCNEVPEYNDCPHCRAMDPRDPCPVRGFGCGWDGPFCDCCTPDQMQAALEAEESR